MAIIKLDHLSYSCSYDDEQEVIDSFCCSGHYKIQFSETIENPELKKRIMQKMSDFHRLTMLQYTERKNCSINVPIEITSYPNVKGISSYDFSNEIIFFRTNNIFRSMSFFQKVGFQKESENLLSLHTLLDSKPYYLRLIEDAANRPFGLDVNGFTSIAWIVSKIDSHRKEMEQNGIEMTEIDMVKINNRTLKICFAIGECGELVELIGVDR